MSRNGSGVYTLPATNPVVPGSTIATVWANGTMTDIAAALTASVAADGQTPMTGNLNANSNKIVGLAVGTVAGNSVEYSQFIEGTQTDVAITGGTINGTTIGATTPSTGKFTTLEASGDVNFTGTGAVQISAGTTLQRPATPVNGDIRYNTTTGQYEGFLTVAPLTTISTITNVTTTATATTVANHNLQTGNYLTISGCTPSAYNGSFSITVTGDTTFTYTMLTNPGGSATVVGTYTTGIWSQIGGGATGTGNNQVFVLNDQVVTASYTVPTGKNASSAGPITINTGVTVTVSTDSTWVIV
jgi:hypothetical protein